MYLDLVYEPRYLRAELSGFRFNKEGAVAAVALARAQAERMGVSACKRRFANGFNYLVCRRVREGIAYVQSLSSKVSGSILMSASIIPEGVVNNELPPWRGSQTVRMKSWRFDNFEVCTDTYVGETTLNAFEVMLMGAR